MKEIQFHFNPTTGPTPLQQSSLISWRWLLALGLIAVGLFYLAAMYPAEDFGLDSEATEDEGLVS